MGINTVSLAHDFLKQYVQKGDICIDATAGRGRDTVFLSALVGDTGRVFAFDVQQAATEETKRRLAEAGLAGRCEVVLDSHSNMGAYAEAGTVRCIVFNFGFLPGGDKSVFTHAETSIAALEAGLRLLMPGGVMSLSIYYGGVTGYEERDALMAYLQTLDDKRYTVLVCSFANRPNDPPMPVYIWKDA